MRRADADARPEDEPFGALLAAARRGERRAFEQLYESLSRRVHAFARARGAIDPEGLVNEVFLQVFTALANFDGAEPQFNAWVFRIARNKLIDESRRRERRPIEISEDRAASERVPGPDDVEGQVLGTLGTESMLAAVDALTDDQRDVVLLRIVSDLTIATISEILGKQPGAVKALQRRAFQRLARDFSDEPVSF